MAQERRRHAQRSVDWFLFDVKSWRGSRSVQRMSFAERGVYLEMMLEQWEKRNLPDDMGDVADAIAATPDQVAEVANAWPSVRRKFVTCLSDPKRIYNVKLEITRRDQRARFKTKQTQGSAAGKASARKRKALQDLSVNGSLTTVERPLTNIQRPSTDKKGEERIREERNGEEVQTTARSKRPIFSGQKLTVFEWQLDDCMKTLGTFTDGFDLHSWFGDLDTWALTANVIVPKRDSGVWLHLRLVEEIKRRGLPLVEAPTETAGSKRVSGLIAGGQAFLQRNRG
jgi:hypothetical protein